MTWLLALVASTLRGGLRWAVAGKMSNLSAVVALLSLSAVTYNSQSPDKAVVGSQLTGHVSVTSARIASLTSLASTAEATLLSAIATLVSTKSTLSTVSGLWAVTGNVANLGAL